MPHARQRRDRKISGATSSADGKATVRRLPAQSQPCFPGPLHSTGGHWWLANDHGPPMATSWRAQPHVQAIRKRYLDHTTPVALHLGSYTSLRMGKPFQSFFFFNVCMSAPIPPSLSVIIYYSNLSSIDLEQMNFFLVPMSQNELPCLLEAPGSPGLCHFQILALALYRTAMGTRTMMKTNQCMKLNQVYLVSSGPVSPYGCRLCPTSCPARVFGEGRAGFCSQDSYISEATTKVAVSTLS